jgi:hypothetical protein
MRIRYIGDFPEVAVPALVRLVKYGEVVELTSDEEKAAGKSLLEQKGQWEAVTKPESPTKAATDTEGGKQG